ncbi:hypothetical protein BJ875DRAFT_440098 [Amylocarpus encephaloides]|uniref:Uncharacterized protein n=1 Tax=Amylocarpus encephaloides TaxID=45428 RepID=A0A9P8C6J0_9HELO|nr:hypothetical protein BJ875DRAFT_440098 [Amylocarpus encephaloides]
MSTFDNYLFTTNSTEYVCPKWINGFDRFWCKHPSACADGPNTLRQYCCNAHTDDICWSGRSHGGPNDINLDTRTNDKREFLLPDLNSPPVFLNKHNFKDA